MLTHIHSCLVKSNTVGPYVQPGQHLCDKLCPSLYTNSLSLMWAGEVCCHFEEKQVFFKLKQATSSTSQVYVCCQNCIPPCFFGHVHHSAGWYSKERLKIRQQMQTITKPKNILREKMENQRWIGSSIHNMWDQAEISYGSMEQHKRGILALISESICQSYLTFSSSPHVGR